MKKLLQFTVFLGCFYLLAVLVFHWLTSEKTDCSGEGKNLPIEQIKHESNLLHDMPVMTSGRVVFSAHIPLLRVYVLENSHGAEVLVKPAPQTPSPSQSEEIFLCARVVEVWRVNNTNFVVLQEIARSYPQAGDVQELYTKTIRNEIE